MNLDDRTLILSAYHAKSHEMWVNSMRRMLSSCEVLSLAPRYFDWRVRGNPLSWYEDLQGLGEKHQKTPFQQMIVTSMCDLAALAGIHPWIGAIYKIVYFHENQFAYPSGSKAPSLEVKMVGLYNAMAANQIVFNSHWNFDSFFEGVAGLISQFPDAVPNIQGDQGLIHSLKSKSVVIPVPISSLSEYAAQLKPHSIEEYQSGQVIKVAWNHRWEYDKGPKELYQLVQGLQDRGVLFELHLFGERFRNQPDEFGLLSQLLGADLHIHQYDNQFEDYLEKLSHCHVVLSTALHEFQGLGILDGLASGCFPLVPKRLSYVEMYPEQYQYDDLHDAIAWLESFQEGIEPETLTQFKLDRKAILTEYSYQKAKANWKALATRYLNRTY